MKIEPTSPQNSRRQFIENTVREELNIQDNIPTKTLLERLDEITLRVEETRLTATNSNDEKTLYNLAKKVFRDGDQSRFSVTCINELLNMIDQKQF